MQNALREFRAANPDYQHAVERLMTRELREQYARKMNLNLDPKDWRLILPEVNNLNVMDMGAFASLRKQAREKLVKLKNEILANEEAVPVRLQAIYTEMLLEWSTAMFKKAFAQPQLRAVFQRA